MISAFSMCLISDKSLLNKTLDPNLFYELGTVYVVFEYNEKDAWSIKDVSIKNIKSRMIDDFTC